ncbi:DUF1553 domain-containing protein [Tundrisphaera lichenicola]|uniref:DUF1553 domain-containing protein n=1 Tax=Tundrisphaera lichenicola TaxID=2029860 RepID=UPI003EBE5666
MIYCWFAILGLIVLEASPAPLVSLDVQPSRVSLQGPDGLVQLIISGRAADGRTSDLTATARYTTRDPQILSVDPDGLIRPLKDGSTTIEVAAGSLVQQVEVVVTDFSHPRTVRFLGEVVPILTRYGCNAGGCHGKSIGQNGFRLSLLGFDPQADYEAIVREGRGRRVFPPNPEASLLLRKPSATIPHGGGKRLEVGSAEYRTLARWIGQGMPSGLLSEPSLVGLAVEPRQRVVPRRGRQQLRVVASFEDGSTADVTRLAQYQSNADDLAEVTPNGVIRALDGLGEAAIMARFGGLVAVSRASIPMESGSADWVDPALRNFIDPLVFRKLRELGLQPSPSCTDAEFARRSSLDLCGSLPEPAEVIAFEEDSDPSKRSKWVDRLLSRPEYADLFAMKWSAILRNKRALGDLAKPGTFGFHDWIRQSIAQNKPYDQFVAEILGARGDARWNPPVAWYRQVKTLEERVEDSAQLFLGLRIGCARCHHHPFEKWGQADYQGYASFFTRIGTKPGSDPTLPLIYNLPEVLAKDPRTGEPRNPKPPGGAELDDLGRYRDPRDSLIEWMRTPENPYFARALVNRYWKHFLGRGLVEPEDDLRISNPPSNPELLDALADDFIRSGYDLKHLARTIATSLAYDRTSLPEGSNGEDRRNFARFYPRRLPAEVLLDAIDKVAGARESFPGVPASTLAIQLPDDGFASPFLDTFGRPARDTACECERSAEANLSQALHLLNSDDVQARIADENGRAARLAQDPRPDPKKVEELYRLAFSRRPTDNELRDCLAFLESHRSGGRLRQGFEDLIWTLINTKEFLFNR